MPALLAAVLGLLPLLHGDWLAGAAYHDKQRAVQWLLLSACLAAWPWRVARDRTILLPSRSVAWLLSFFFLLGACASLGAASPRQAWAEWGLWVGSVVLAWQVASAFVAAGPAAPRVLDSVGRWVALGCLLYAAQALLLHALALGVREQPDLRVLIPGFDNYRFFNHAQTAMLPLLCLAAAHGRGRLAAWASVAASLQWMLLCVSGGRGTMAGLGVAMLLGFVFGASRRWAFRMLATACAGGGLFLLLYVAVPVLLGLPPAGAMHVLVERTMSDPSSSRLPLWRLAAEMIAGAPWLGDGPAHFAHRVDAAVPGSHPHNLFLQLGAEWGLPALACFVLAIGLVLRALWQRASRGRDGLAAIWLAAVAGVLVDACVSGSWVMPVSQLWIVLLCGCAWGCSAARAQTAGRAGDTALAPAGGVHAARVAGVLLIAGVALAGMGRLAIPQAWEAGARDRDYAGRGATLFSPRFWRQGRF